MAVVFLYTPMFPGSMKIDHSHEMGYKLWDHSFNTHSKFSEKLTFLPPATHTCVRIRRLRNISFSVNSAYVLNE